MRKSNDAVKPNLLNGDPLKLVSLSYIAAVSLDPICSMLEKGEDEREETLCRICVIHFQLQPYLLDDKIFPALGV